MKPRVRFVAVLAILAAASAAMASGRALYRIELRDGSEALANDRPYHRGSVVLFHLHSSGVWSWRVPEPFQRLPLAGRHGPIAPDDSVRLSG